jgi:hypothetical protein
MQKQRDLFFQTLLQRFASDDYQGYQNLIMESAAIIPAETEEELYRLRNIRLAEKGFAPIEEAIGVYQPVRPDEIRNRPAKHLTRSAPHVPLPPTPLAAGIMLERESTFGRALAAVDQPHLRMLLQSEFAGLCNSIIVADRQTIHNRKDLGVVVKKACGYIGIGLETISGDGKSLIRTYPLSDIFRVGYGQALELKWQAEKWQKNSWYASAGLRLNFWDEVLMGVVGGLLISRPLFFDNDACGMRYREFFSADDIASTRQSLKTVMLLDDLFSRLGIDIPPDHPKNTLTYKNILLSLWSAHCMGLPVQPPAPAEISLEDFRPFYETLWDEGKKPRVIADEAKAAFKSWITAAGKIGQKEFSNHFARIFTDLFEEIEEEYATVSAEDLDTRYIQLFRLKK